MSMAASDGHLAAAYALIYHFLKAHAHEKAAQALKKSVRDVIVLNDSVAAPEGIPLDEIIGEWKRQKETIAGLNSSAHVLASPDDSTASSGDDSSSDSSSSDTDSDSFSSPNRKLVSKAQASFASARSVSVSEALTSSNGKTKGSSLQNSSKKSSKSSSGGSDSSTPDPDPDAGSFDTSTSNAKKPLSNGKSEPKLKAATALRSSDKSAGPALDGDSDGIPLKQVDVSKAKKKKSPTTVDGASEVKVTKKRRTSVSGTAVVTAVTTTVREEETEQVDEKINGVSLGRKGKGKQPRKSNTPFQRIKATDVNFADDRLKNNSFEAKGRPTNDYGERANRDLIVTRGDGFRKEKNKKKRGSYRGGEITMESHSVKFNY